ncbi:MAG: hypothetical protein M3R55_08270 [Acidobacteriota bacterium]|nr:hypothetical protein [Acidobacteriota bacterium]
MARGWESKHIESQQEEAQKGRQMRPALTVEERARHDRRQSLELALATKREELSASTSESHRHYLTRAINDLETALSNS